MWWHSVGRGSHDPAQTPYRRSPIPPDHQVPDMSRQGFGLAVFRGAASARSGFELVAGSVADIEDVDGILADGEDDPVLMAPFAPPPVEEFVDFFGELVAFSSDRAPQGAGLQSVDGLIQSVQPLGGGGGRDVLA
jgi:hypothetical protein